MDIQIALNWTIQILVMGFVCVMVMDFVNGLFSLPYYAMPSPVGDALASLLPQMGTATSKTNAPVATSSQAFALQQEPAVAPIPEPEITPDAWEKAQFAQLADPWELTTDIQSIPIQHQPVVLQLSTLKLLAPAAQVQPKARTTTKPATAKRTTTPTNKAATQTNSQSRKKSAA